MSAWSPLPRRRLLGFIAYAAACLPTGLRLLGPDAALPGSAAIRAVRDLAALLGRGDRLRGIGAACLMALPAAEASAPALVRLVLDGRPASSALGRTVAERVRSDFAQGRTILVEGWLLSLTEARLYALAALAPANG